MDRRKRVEAIMSSRLFREELERIVDNHGREGTSGILQQISEMVGVPAARVGSLFKNSNCVLPVNDIRGVESMGYAKGEKILRCKLAATFRLLDLYGWTQGLGAQVTARLNADQELFLVNPFGLMYHEVTASSLNKVDMQGNVVEQGTTNFGINLRRMFSECCSFPDGVMFVWFIYVMFLLNLIQNRLLVTLGRTCCTTRYSLRYLHWLQSSCCRLITQTRPIAIDQWCSRSRRSRFAHLHRRLKRARRKGEAHP